MLDDGQQTIKLHYIDKLHTTLFESGRSETHNTVAQIVMSVAIILVVSGSVKFDSHVSIAGLTVTASIPLLLVTAACVLGTLVLIASVRLMHEERIRKAIICVYESLGFHAYQTPAEKKWSLFVYPSVSQVLMTGLDKSILDPMIASSPQVLATKRTRGMFGRILLMCVMLFIAILFAFILPILAECLAVIFAVRQQGWSLPVWIAVTCLIFLNLGAFFTMNSTVRESVPDAVRVGLTSVADALKASGIEIPPELLSIIGGGMQNVPPENPHTAVTTNVETSQTATDKPLTDQLD